MKIAIASGKGGAGKTSVAASLARVWGGPLAAVDTDAEAPNLHLFLKPTLSESQPCHLTVPALDPALCTACDQCHPKCPQHINVSEEFRKINAMVEAIRRGRA